MSVYIGAFIFALVLAAIVIIWIAYCMFIRERHKSEFYQYNISDLQHRAFQLSQEEEAKPVEKAAITAGIFILPSRRKQKDDYNKRPDYPESPVPHMDTSSTNQLVDIFDDTADVHYRDGITDVDSSAPYHSDV